MGFKFLVGDMVVPKVSMEALRLYLAINRLQKFDVAATPQIMIVNQRSMEECPGGVQYHYACRAWITGKENLVINFNEVELQAFSIEECLALFPKD